MLKLDNGVKTPANVTYVKDNTKCLKIDDIDINKIRVSEKKLYSKTHNAYKYYVFYEHDNEYIPLRIIFKNVVGYYDVYNDDKKMNFSVNYEDDDKLINILAHIDEKININYRY